MPTKKNPESADQAAATQIDFESALAELESLVEKMETGELSLEASLEAFERGVKLTRDCQGALRKAELRIQTLSEENDDIILDDDPVPPDEESD